jgi:hypothetical protein
MTRLQLNLRRYTHSQTPMKLYADRFLAASYRGEEPVSLGLARSGADPIWEVYIPLPLFAGLKQFRMPTIFIFCM